MDGGGAALDARRSINISMEPFRAFVADKLNERQRRTGFVDAELLHRPRRDLARHAAVAFPSLWRDRDDRERDSSDGEYSFQLGAVAFLLAVLWTVVTSRSIRRRISKRFSR